MNLCECGCGQECRNRFVSGHNMQKGKVKFSEEHRKNLSIAAKKRGPQWENIRKAADANRGKPSWNKGLELTRQHKKHLSESHLKRVGGCEGYLHQIAWKTFGKMYCEKCGMTLYQHYKKYNKRFDMHNTLIPKDYKSKDPNAWMTLCKPCHIEVEYEEGSHYRSKETSSD